MTIVLCITVSSWFIFKIMIGLRYFMLTSEGADFRIWEPEILFATMYQTQQLLRKIFAVLGSRVICIPSSWACYFLV